ncbi:MAG: UDP-N-acetylglucosamine--N-acetylmuramyl-(pentapeptide) pyrophosphoryl-undecaprenol N-acetylglucosamine transferase, partial [bacterium]
MNFLFVCAGTAGHINPALAIAGELREIFPEGKFLFVGAGREMEKRLIPREGYPLENLRVTGLARGFSGQDIRHNMETLNNLVNANREARKVIEAFRPDIVIGTGGYICYPVVRAAHRMGIPTVLHESNVEPGMANLMLSGMVDKMLVAFPGTEKSYRKPGRVVVTGTPVRGDFLPISREEARRRLGFAEGEPLVVSFWGSLGASVMNDMMAEMIVKNAETRAFRHIHATGGGEEGLHKMQERIRRLGLRETPPNL